MGSNNQSQSMEIEVIWEKSTTKSKTQISDKAKVEEENTIPSIGVRNCGEQHPSVKVLGRKVQNFSVACEKSEDRTRLRQ